MRILHGEYDIAIMVYEKLFAMMAQDPARLLDKCDLVVVDECQLVSDKQRGPKLEFVLSRILARNPEEDRALSH